jgi:gluconolactonase
MFFHPPKDIATTVFAALPDALKNADETNEWVRSQPHGGPTTSLLEGPSFDLEGNLWCVDLPNGRIYRIGKDGVFTKVAEYDGWPNGLKFHRDGRVFIADYKNGIMVMDPVSGRVTPYLVRANLERFKAVNDLFFAANGDLYFTDQGLTGLHDPTGRLFRVRPDGQVACLLDNVPSPNGLVMNLDESMIYLAVTRGNCIWRVPLLPDGGVAKVGLFVQMSGGWGGPDGLALDSQGRLAIAHVGMGAVWVVDRLGEPVYRVRSCRELHTTNVAFGGPTGCSLFITESASATILRAELDVPGKPMFSHQGASGR